jgi:hypothetical protein
MGRLQDLDFLSQVFGTPTSDSLRGSWDASIMKLVLRFGQIVFTQLPYLHIFWMSATISDKLTKGMEDTHRTFRADPLGEKRKPTAARLWLKDY